LRDVCNQTKPCDVCMDWEVGERCCKNIQNKSGCWFACPKVRVR
jgi:hypothetical protein